jgi:hypothetical protein
MTPLRQVETDAFFFLRSAADLNTPLLLTPLRQLEADAFFFLAPELNTSLAAGRLSCHDAQHD